MMPAGATFSQLLVAAARRGVQVRLLLDQIGCLGLRKSAFKALRDAGGEFSWFYSLPLWRHSRFMNLRNHRKLQIIDGEIAFVGGMNIGEEYIGQLEPRAVARCATRGCDGNVVRYLQRIFAEDWFFATDARLAGNDYFPQPASDEPHMVQIISGGPDLPREPVPKSIAALLAAARERRLALDRLLRAGSALPHAACSFAPRAAWMCG